MNSDMATDINMPTTIRDIFADLEFMPEELSGQVFYKPAENKHEDSLKAYLKSCWPKYYGTSGKDCQKG